tara:strand:- start:2754 stop:3632 length:879 start_codon:yes stop_codon:yes gene_type:complete
MRKHIWPIIIFFKILLFYIPILKRVLKFMGFYSPGKMLDTSYAIKTYMLHQNAYDEFCNTASSKKTMLEIGPGGSNLSSFIAHLKGFSRSVLIDIEPLHKNVLKNSEDNFNKIKFDLLDSKKFHPDESFKIIGFNDINYEHMSEGSSSLEKLPSNSIDFLWSHSVLQHIHINALNKLLKEMHRVLKPEGIMSHKIDLKDCIAYGLNNMRFSDNVWHSDLFFNSGFYTNRIRKDELLNYFILNDFEIIKEEHTFFNKIPLQITSCSEDIQKKYSSYDLKHSGLHCILKKNNYD